MASVDDEKIEPANQSQGDEVEIDSELQHLRELHEEHGATWDGIDDPKNPYNWSSMRKVTISAIVSSGQLVTLMSASMMAAALPQIAKDLGLSMSVIQITFSIYFLGLGFAPFLLAPLSEIYGRKSVWIAGNIFYILWNSLCPVGDNAGLMIFGRLMSGSGASVGVALTGPIMADMYHAKDRGKSLALATLLPYLGPALGPILGGVLSDQIQWHWLFWVLSMFDAVITAVGVLVISESYTPLLLARLAATQDPSARQSEMPWTRKFYADLFAKLRVTLLRPIELLLHRPVMQLIAFVIAVNFGVYTLLLSTFATLFLNKYHESELISSLHYIAIAIGSTTAAQAGGRVMDYMWKRLAARHGGKTTPEYRAPYMLIGAVLMPAGLLWYGWCAEKQISWVMVDVGVIIFAVGCFIVAQALLAYLLDEFKHAASANAASRVLSNVFGFVFPIFGPQLYDRLGYGWGNSLLALLFIVLGLPAPFIFWFWGSKLRAIGRKD